MEFGLLDGETDDQAVPDDGVVLPALSAQPDTPEQWSNREDRQEFFIPVQGFVWFYPEEVEIINHPAFQRLAGMHQLGLAYLVYRGATHRRLEHTLGTVGIAQRILDAVSHNCRKRRRVEAHVKDEWIIGLAPTDFEIRFVRLACLLHDIGHVPYGHTFEDELHLLNKHDGPERLNKIFCQSQWHGQDVEPLGRVIDRQFKKYIPEQISDAFSASELLRLIILKASDEHRETEERTATAGLRVGICRDMVGNTICADLLDYLHRDWYHVGKEKRFDERILHYMEIRTPRGRVGNREVASPTAEDQFVISIGNRPKLRTDGVSAILELLESRYQLSEAVIFHRTKMTATAMLERAISLALPSRVDKPSETPSLNSTSTSIAQLEDLLLNNSEEVLLSKLANGSDLAGESRGQDRPERAVSRKLASRILTRDLYEPFLSVTFQELETIDARRIQKIYADGEDAATNRAVAVRLLEADFGLPTGSLVLYCPEARMNSKIAQVRLFVEGTVEQFDTYEGANEDQLSAGHLKAQLLRFKRLWRIGFFIDAIAKQQACEFLPQLREAIRVLVLGLHPRDESIEDRTADIAQRLSKIPTFHLRGHTSMPRPKPLLVARGDASTVTEIYPMGARLLRSFFVDAQSTVDS